MKRIILICAIALLNVLCINAQTLPKGAIAFIGVNEDAGPTAGRDHSFTWIALQDIPAGQVIYFTEQGWNRTNTDTGTDANYTASGYWVGNTEGHFSWTSPGGGITIGTIIHIYESGTDVMNVVGGGTVSSILAGSGWNLSAGDQVLAYQSSTGAKPAGVVPTFISAIHLDDGSSVGYDATSGWSSLVSSTSVSFSNVPPGLTNGVDCIALFNPNDAADFEKDNIRYKGTLTGTSTAVIGAINTAFSGGSANWEADNTTPFDITSSGYASPSISNGPSAPSSATVAVTAYLEGAYNGTNLSTTINSSIPTTQPYSINGHTGGTAGSIPANAVDWVLVELREAGSAVTALNSTKVGSTAGFLMNNGSIKATDGTSDLTVSLSGNTGADFYIVVYHRNHLPIMSANAISESTGKYTIDFTSNSANTYQTTTALASLTGGKFGMPSGDIDQDGDVDATDLSSWRTVNGAVYDYTSNGTRDLNLDGAINAVDRNLFLQANTSKTRHVPSTL